jgi:hypothetical protein
MNVKTTYNNLSDIGQTFQNKLPFDSFLDYMLFHVVNLLFNVFLLTNISNTKFNVSSPQKYDTFLSGLKIVNQIAKDLWYDHIKPTPFPSLHSRGFLSKSTNKWLIDHKINILQWPSQSRLEVH